MAYELKDVVNVTRVFHNLESEAKDFLFLSAAAIKNKEHKIKSAECLLEAIEEYKKLPLEVRKELEKDKTSSASRIVELEKACREAVKK